MITLLLCFIVTQDTTAEDKDLQLTAARKQTFNTPGFGGISQTKQHYLPNFL